jgi:hypothetical protein
MNTIETFWDRIEQGSADDCWPWQGGLSAGGYGRFTLEGKHYQAHRLAWERTYRTRVPKGKLVRHTCRNRLCCNPAHLRLGTQGDDVEAKVKGPVKPDRPSEAAELAKLIKTSDEDTLTLMHRLGVSRQTVWRIRTGRSWKNL